MPEQSLTATAHIAALLCNAERHALHSHAEHGNESQPSDWFRRAETGLVSERKRQGYVCFLALSQTALELRRVMNQHVLTGEGFGSDQA